MNDRRPGLLDGYGVHPDGPHYRGGTDAGTAALEALDRVGERVHEREADADAREQEAHARLRRARAAVLSAVVAALVLSLLGIGIAVYTARNTGQATAEEVAPRVAEEVARATIADSRGNRLAAARAALANTNAELTRRGLGVVPEPDPSRYTDATLPDAYVIAASTAATLSYLPDPIVAGLRVDPATGRLIVPASVLLGAPGGSSSSDGPAAVDPGAPGVELIPGEESPDRSTPPTLRPDGGGPSSSPGGSAGGGGSPPARPSVPIPTRRPGGLLPTGIPLPNLPTEVPLPRVPLLGGIVTS